MATKKTSNPRKAPVADDFDVENDLKHVFQTAACVAVEKVDEVLRDLEMNGAFEDDEAVT